MLDLEVLFALELLDLVLVVFELGLVLDLLVLEFLVLKLLDLELLVLALVLLELRA